MPPVSPQRTRQPGECLIPQDVDASLLRLARFRGWGGLGCLWDLLTVALHRESEISARRTRSPGVYIMTRTLKASLLIASMLVVLWTTSSQACHFLRRACQPTQSYCQSGYAYGSPTGYYSSGQGGYVTSGGGYYGGGYPGGTAGYPGGYGYSQPGVDFGRPGYNPGGLGGPASGMGCGPGSARRLRPGALTDHRLCDHPAGSPRPGRTGALGRRRRWSIDYPRRVSSRPAHEETHNQRVRPGVTPEATRPLDRLGPPNRRGPSEAAPGAIA